MFSVFGAELPLQKPWSGENYPCVFYIRRRTSLTISVPTKDNVAQGAGPVDHAHVSVPQDIPAPCYILDHTHEPTEILSYAFLAKEMDKQSKNITSELQLSITHIIHKQVSLSCFCCMLMIEGSKILKKRLIVLVRFWTTEILT